MPEQLLHAWIKTCEHWQHSVWRYWLLAFVCAAGVRLLVSGPAPVPAAGSPAPFGTYLGNPAPAHGGVPIPPPARLPPSRAREAGAFPAPVAPEAPATPRFGTFAPRPSPPQGGDAMSP